jgi:phosphodiesterase/alkaline phosphatase D-like protein
MMLDDHEIVDNWEPGRVPDRTRDEPLELGRSAYLTYQRTLGPPVQARSHTVHPLWYEAEPAKLPFFFVDSRTDRQPRTLSEALDAQMLGEDQLRELEAWISRERDDKLQPKFIVSSSMLLPRKKYYVDGAAGAFRADSWQGYPATLHELLAKIADSDLQNLVFLSGDEHHSCVACIEVSNLSRDGVQPVVFHSIHCSGLYSPFPFANGKPEDLLETDSFLFEVAGEQYRCRVLSTKFIGAGDGFATIRCTRNGEGWSVHYNFDQDRGSGELVHPHP